MKGPNGPRPPGASALVLWVHSRLSGMALDGHEEDSTAALPICTEWRSLGLVSTARTAASEGLTPETRAVRPETPAEAAMRLQAEAPAQAQAFVRRLVDAEEKPILAFI